MKTTLKVEGMTCNHCVGHVKNALEGLSGVQAADVSLKNKTADVTHDESVTVASMIEAVTEEGYDASL